MGNDLTIGGPGTVFDVTGTDPDSQTTVLPSPNQSLNDIAHKLGVDPNALAQANPQILNANEKLGPLQSVNVPAALNIKWPTVTQGPDAAPAAAQPSQPPKANLPPRPLGASEDATGMKAQLQETWDNVFGKENARQASFPDASAQHSLDETNVQGSIPDTKTQRFLDENQKQASIADKTTPEFRKIEGDIYESNEKAAVKKRLNDLGLPSEPPNVTEKDVADYHLHKTPDPEEMAEKGKEEGAEGVIDGAKDWAKHQLLHEAGHEWHHWLDKQVEQVAPENQAAQREALESMSVFGKAATASGPALMIANGLLDNAENNMQFNSNRDIAKIEMHGDAFNASSALIDQKFPQKRPLNEAGNQLDNAVVNKWRSDIDPKLDDIFENVRARTDKFRRQISVAQFEPFKSAHIEDFKKDMEGYNEQLNGVLKQGTVDLANQRMAVYYDPRNWNE